MKFEDLPTDQLDRVFGQELCDIDGEFFGFTDIYENLSKIIPKHFDVIDLGCAYNSQCVLFNDHKSFTAVDIGERERFTQDNCTIYVMTIEQFIADHIGKFNLKETFAICSYVPPWGGDNMKMVRDSFINVFTYYPHGGFNFHNEMVKRIKERSK